MSAADFCNAIGTKRTFLGRECMSTIGG